MIFTALAAWQAWLVLAVAVAAAVAIFLLKIKPPQIVVPSLSLWSRVLDQRRERSLWERIRKAVSLAAIVLITLAIALAVLRPQLAPSNVPAASPSGAVATSRRATVGRAAPFVIILDSSWSMLAETSNGQTRWDIAVARARALATSAAGEDIVLATTADGVVEGPTPDVSLIEAALDRISPSGGATSAANTDLYGAGATYLITDGAVVSSLAAGNDPNVTVESVFEAADNVAITAFDVRPGTSLDSAGEVFLSVANYAKTAQDVRISLNRGTVSLLDTHVQLAAGEGVQRAVPLARAGDARLRARVAARANALVVDDEAVAWIPGARPIVVAVVSDQPASFGALLSQDPNVRPRFVSPKDFAPGNEDVVIFDRVLPAVPARVPALFVAPPSAPPIKTQGLVPAAGPALASLMAGVDLSTMAFDSARRYTTAGLVPVAFSDTQTPLVSVHDEVDQRFALFSFSVTDSKLMFAPGFPVLMRNVLEWLAHPVSGGTRRLGWATFSGNVESLVGPDGREAPLTKIGNVTMAALLNVGFYDLKAGRATSVLAVNTTDPEISDLQRTHLSNAQRVDPARVPTRGRPWWLFAAMVALVLVAGEWFTWQRRITV